MYRAEKRGQNEKSIELQYKKTETGLLGTIRDMVKKTLDRWNGGDRAGARQDGKATIQRMLEVGRQEEKTMETLIRGAAAEAQKIDKEVDIARIQAAEKPLLKEVQQTYTNLEWQALNQEHLLDEDDIEFVGEEQSEPAPFYDELAPRRETKKESHLTPKELLVVRLKVRGETVEDLSKMFSSIKLLTKDFFNAVRLGSLSDQEMVATLNDLEKRVGEAQAQFALFMKQPPTISDEEAQKLLAGDPFELVIRGSNLREEVKRIKQNSAFTDEEREKYVLGLKNQQQNFEAFGYFKEIIINEIEILSARFEMNRKVLVELPKKITEAKNNRNPAREGELVSEYTRLEKENKRLEKIITERRAALSLGKEKKIEDFEKPFNSKEASTKELKDRQMKLEKEWKEEIEMSRQEIKSLPGVRGRLDFESTLEHLQAFYAAAEEKRQELQKTLEETLPVKQAYLNNQKMLEKYEAALSAKELQRRFPKNYKTVKLDDLAAQPEDKIRELYSNVQLDQEKIRKAYELIERYQSMFWHNETLISKLEEAIRIKKQIEDINRELASRDKKKVA